MMDSRRISRSHSRRSKTKSSKDETNAGNGGRMNNNMMYDFNGGSRSRSSTEEQLNNETTNYNKKNDKKTNYKNGHNLNKSRRRRRFSASNNKTNVTNVTNTNTNTNSNNNGSNNNNNNNYFGVNFITQTRQDCMQDCNNYKTEGHSLCWVLSSLTILICCFFLFCYMSINISIETTQYIINGLIGLIIIIAIIIIAIIIAVTIHNKMKSQEAIMLEWIKKGKEDYALEYSILKNMDLSKYDYVNIPESLTIERRNRINRVKK